MYSSLLFLLGLLSLVSAVLTPLGIKFDKRAALPTLTLPYGTWQANSYNTLSDIYIFKNIRFGASTAGENRFAKPQPPIPVSTIQDGSYGPYCPQGAPKGLNLLGPGDQSAIGGAVNQFLGGIPLPLFEGGDEDCLFLDVYVPGKAIRNTASALPVLAFVYGGGNLYFRGKGFFGATFTFLRSGMISNSGNDIIFVAMNYRVGAYGWLAGTTMEKEGVPNAGLWDQRAAFEWIQNYINLLGGDPTQVTAMGESAGASSLYHHLVAEGGTLDPMFKKVILQSPAYEFMWDRQGLLQETFEQFAAFAGCAGQGVACLRAVDSSVINTANTALNLNSTDGTFAVGPSTDGSLIRQLAPLEYASGNFWHAETLLVSHTSAEAVVFVDGHIQTDAEFNDYIDFIFPAYAKNAGINTIVEEFYPPVSTNHTYATETDRVQALLRDSSITCNVRYLDEAFGDENVWNMQYSVSPGWHATDLIPTFYNPFLNLDTFIEDLAYTVVPLLAGISEAYQSYFTSFVKTGDPNTDRLILDIPSAITWNHPDSSGASITGVLNVDDLGFSTITDTQNEKTVCDFWVQVLAATTNLGGYAPPGAVVSTNLVNVPNDPSANYA